VREGVYVVLLGAVGVDSASALTFSLLGFLLRTAVTTVPGALFYIRGSIAVPTTTSDLSTEKSSESPGPRAPPAP
jgi:hypothetical protein